MRDLLLPLILIVVVLTVPVVPFVLGGDALEPRVQLWLRQESSPTVLAAGVVVLLGSDILLPIPSSAVSTLAGSVLGFWLGTAASWLGMTAGSLLGFAVARSLGRKALLWLSRPEAVERVQGWAQRYGRLVLGVARPVPVLAEASVLLLGTAGLSWSRLWAPLLLSNLGIAAVYSALGNWVRLPVPLSAAIALPMAASLLAKRFLPDRSGGATR